MNVLSVRRSLQTKLLLAVVICALMPLFGVGAWLSSSAVRSGELLLRSQLDSAASRSAAMAKSRWDFRESDVMLLATNTPVRMALRDSSAADTAPAFVRRALATMPGILNVVMRDAHHRVRWTLGEVDPEPRPDIARSGQAGGSRQSPLMSLHVVISDDSSSRPLGEVDAQIRLDALAPASASAEVAPSQFVALHDRKAGTWLAPAGLSVALLDGDRFTWHDHRWLAVRRGVENPAIDVVAAAQLDPFLTPFARTARVGETALALAALVVMILTIVVTSRLTRSLGRLAFAADGVARGELETRIDVSSDDEVGRVARAFNAMIENLRRMMHELSQREAVAAMGELAATLAHQVRSPATAIRLDVQRAHDKLSAGSTERALLARALGQLDRLERAIAGSLKVARSAGAEFRPVDLREPLGRAVDGVRREHAGRLVRLDEFGFARESLVGRGDAPSLEQLFANVLTNAAQASPDGGSVRVSLTANGSAQVTVVIRDDGPGMTDDILVRAGEAMFSTKPEGSGLGLAIANRIAAAHGGTLSIASVPGGGTTVTIELPRG